MTPAIVTTSLDAARAARASLDAALGLPSFGVNAATGETSVAGITSTACTIVEARDWPTAGSTSYVLPIGPDYAEVAGSLGYVVQNVDMETLGAVTVFGLSAPVQSGTARTVEQARAAKLASIRARTDDLRTIGFEYTDTRPNGAHYTSRYSLDHNALRQAMEAKSWASDDIRDGTAHCPQPLPWSNVDRTGFAYLGTLQAVIEFARAASHADYALTVAGAGLEMTLAQAETLEDVEAVRDSRA